MLDQDAIAARKEHRDAKLPFAVNDFPCGLVQPENSYRFGQEALLLACFAARTIEKRMGQGSQRGFFCAEPGCGCGAALCAFAMLQPNAICLGLEKQDALLTAARQNARMLQLESRLNFWHTDLQKDMALPKDYEGKCLMVFANPPWRGENEGKKTKKAARRDAMWGSGGLLRDFCVCARKLLAHHGFFCAILPAQKLAGICVIFEQLHLGLRKILPLAAYEDQAPARVLLLCQKNSQSDTELLRPLAIHKHTASGMVYTAEALSFCPWLAKTHRD